MYYEGEGVDKCVCRCMHVSAYMYVCNSLFLKHIYMYSHTRPHTCMHIIFTDTCIHTYRSDVFVLKCVATRKYLNVNTFIKISLPMNICMHVCKQHSICLSTYESIYLCIYLCVYVIAFVRMGGCI